MFLPPSSPVLHGNFICTDTAHPIDLRILAWFKLERQKERGGSVVLVPLREVQAYPRFTALVALPLEDFIDLMSRVLLLAGQMLIFGKQRVSSCLERTEHRRRFLFREPVGLRR